MPMTLVNVGSPSSPVRVRYVILLVGEMAVW